MMDNFKVVMIGDAQVGKTSILHRLTMHKFERDYSQTIGSAFFTYVSKQDNDFITLYIWDTAGQEKYRNLGPIFYRESKAAVVVFDLTDLKSYENIKEWIKYFNEIQQGSLIYIVGNKSDLESFCVNENDVLAYANSLGAKYFIVSALNGSNVERLFQEISKDLLTAQKSMPVMDTKPIATLKKEQEKSGCC